MFLLRFFFFELRGCVFGELEELGRSKLGG